MALTLPRLGSFGLWEPWELVPAEKARATSETMTFGSAMGMIAHAQLQPFLRALGVKVFGASEVGVRLFGALSGIGALMAVFWAGEGLLRRRAALIAVLVLGATPLFALSARQVTGDMPLVAALALALGAGGRWAWPPDGARRPRDLALGLLALGLGYAAGGVLLGIVLPSLALGLAVLIGRGLRPAATDDAEHAPTDGTAALSSPGIGHDVKAGLSLGASFSGGAKAGLTALGALAGLLVVLSFTGLRAGDHSVFLGGSPHAGGP
ncbi:MAG TPA: glycosyltransferase family 39 protein, partial [Polyangia bacterium]|nr:glycosyltransferase family 39 protein [Polyangia bacterium]